MKSMISQYNEWIKFTGNTKSTISSSVNIYVECSASDKLEWSLQGNDLISLALFLTFSPLTFLSTVAAAKYGSNVL